MGEINKNCFDKARSVMTFFYSFAGALVLSSLFWLVYRFGLLNIFYTLFFIWLAMYFFFARSFVESIKARSDRWGKIKRDFMVAIIRAPMTVVNILFLVLFFSGSKVPLIMWIFLLLAWSIFPCFKLIDFLEKKKCS